jgi:hypothetical protein
MSLPSMAFRVFNGTAASVVALLIGVVGLGVALRSRGGLSGRFWSAVPWMILLSPLAWYTLLIVPVVIVATLRLVDRGRLRPWHLILFAAACFGTLGTIHRGPVDTTTTILDLIPTAALLIIALLDARADDPSNGLAGEPVPRTG